MATLTMQPIGPSPAPAAQEDQRKAKNPAVDAADLTDIDSGWVVLKNSDIVSADLAASTISGSQRLGFSTIPSWARWVLGGVVYTVMPFYDRVRQLEEETIEFVENAVEIVEHIAEATEKLAANVAEQLPKDGSPQKAVEDVEHIAEVVDDDAEKVEAVIEKEFMIIPAATVLLLFFSLYGEDRMDVVWIESQKLDSLKMKKTEFDNVLCNYLDDEYWSTRAQLHAA